MIDGTTEKRLNCRLYRGLKPCGHEEDCVHCSAYEPIGARVLIIKLGALGDVLRTTPLLRGLKRDLPGCEIVWLTSPDSVQLLRGNPLIDQLWITGSEALVRLQVEEFDRLICLDKEPEAIACAALARAGRKTGFGMTAKGRLMAFNPAAEENLRLGLSDQFKFHENEKSYQQLAFESAELAYDPALDYVFQVSPEDRDWAKEFLDHHLGPDREMVIGFNLGGADVFANKRWKMSRFMELRELIYRRWNSRASILCFGGPKDQERLKRAEVMSTRPMVNTGLNSMARFAALLAGCDVLVTGDSLGMHLCLAVGGKVLVLMGSTTPREIELYNRGEIMFTDLDCAPCYKKVCPVKPDCMERFTAPEVMERLVGLVESGE